MDRWLYQRYRRNLHRPTKPPRASRVELPYIWAAHLLAWVITQHQRWYPRKTTSKPPTGGFSDSQEKL